LIQCFLVLKLDANLYEWNITFVKISVRLFMGNMVFRVSVQFLWPCFCNMKHCWWDISTSLNILKVGFLLMKILPESLCNLIILLTLLFIKTVEYCPTTFPPNVLAFSFEYIWNLTSLESGFCKRDIKRTIDVSSYQPYIGLIRNQLWIFFHWMLICPTSQRTCL